MILLSSSLNYDPPEIMASISFFLEIEIVTTKIVNSKSLKKICRLLLSAMNVHKCNGLSDSSKRNDAFVNLLHSPSGETETRRSVWPNRSWIQLVLFLLFHAKVRACANASAWETCIEKSPRSLDERCKTKLRLCQSKHQDYSHILFYQNRSLEVLYNSIHC